MHRQNRAKNNRFAAGSCHLVFLGSQKGQLIPCPGPFEDARLADYQTYQLVSSSRMHDAAWQKLPLACPSLMSTLTPGLLPGVRWKIQFGQSLVYFGCPKGLPTAQEASLTTRDVDAAVLERAMDGPRRTSFTTLTFPCVADVVRWLRGRTAVTKEEVRHTLRATEKRLSGETQLVYERTAASREAVLDGAAFTAPAFHDEQRCANYIIVPPLPLAPSAAVPAAAPPPVVRCQAVAATQAAGTSRRLQVAVRQGRVTVSLLDDSAFANYVRLEERHVLTLDDGATEVHVVHGEEFGSSVAAKANLVRVEMRLVMPPHGDGRGATAEGRQALWENFVRRSFAVRAMLMDLHTHVAGGGHPVTSLQPLCQGDSAAAPCANPQCNLRHLATACLLDADGGCADAPCRYWHGFTEVQELLGRVGLAGGASLDRAPFSMLLVRPHLQGRLRAALSLHLHRLRDAVSTQLFGDDYYAEREKSDQDEEEEEKEREKECVRRQERLVELVRQYNAVAHTVSANENAKDVSLLYRCCQRLKSPLPLLAARDEVRAAWVRGEKCLLVDSSTGSGKSTQLPQYLAECAAEQLRYDRAGAGVMNKQKVVVCVEPRPLAAVALADYVAREYDDPLAGNTTRRVQSVVDATGSLSDSAHIVYTTAHVCLQLLREGQLDLANQVHAVVVDEAHERSVAGDVVLGVLKTEMEATRRAFQLVVCSATLQREVFRAYLPGARHLSVKSRLYPVEVLYANRFNTMRHGADYVQETVNATITVIEDAPTMTRAHRAAAPPERHVLVFLPTAADVEAARNLLEAHIANQVSGGTLSTRSHVRRHGLPWDEVRVCTVSDRQPLQEQLNAFAVHGSDVRKVIFATAVAETSVTIDGVGYVVDSGLTQATAYDTERQLSELMVRAVSQSSAVQRAGRAGRTGPGLCIRLYTQTCFNLFEENNEPEVKTAPLHMVLLQLTQMKCSVCDFDWIDKPNQAAIEATFDELQAHHAIVSPTGGGAAAEEGTPLCLSDFGAFLCRYDDLPVHLGKVLYEAKLSKSAEQVAVCALVAATIQRFFDLFAVERGSEEAFYEMLRDYGRRHDALARGDALCATHLVAAALQARRAAGKSHRADGNAAELRFLSPQVLTELAEHAEVYLRSAYATDEPIRTDECRAAVLALSPATVDAHATDVQRLLARCLCFQVAVRQGAGETGYHTLGAAPQRCLLASTSFLKQQLTFATAVRGLGSEAYGQLHGRLDPRGLPEICVFGNLFSSSPTRPGVISLCTPVMMEWLPVAQQALVAERMDTNRAAQVTVWSGRVPSVLLSEWRPREVAKWLSRQCNGAACAVSVDYATHQLSLSCTPEAAEELSNKLSLAIDHARARHRQTCYEVALNGFCRVTWRAGCEASEVLRDKSEYVTLQFSGVCDPAITCLDLDLSEMVEAWSWRWFGRPMLVTVRSGSGGASPASGQWTALVTFANCKDARDFYARHETAVEADCRKVLVEPYCEHEPLAPSVDATVPLCRIGLRLYTSHCDPESVNMDSRTTNGFPAKLVDDFRRQVCAALPSGVTVESHYADQAQGLLHMQFVAANAKVANDALFVLHHIRGPSMHFCPLFLDVAYSVVFPLLPLVNKPLQDVLQDALARRMEANEDDLHCEPLHAQGKRSLLLRCTNAAVLCRAEAYLRELTAVHEVPLPGRTHVEQMNRARAVAAQRGAVVYKVNAQLPSTEDCVVECQLQLREADGKLCFIGSNEAFLKLQRALEEMEPLNAVSCTTLTMPPRGAAAVRCSRWVSFLEARCRASGEPAQVVRDRDTIVFLGPAAVVEEARCDLQVAQLWRAIDGEVNAHYDSQQAGDEAQDVTAGDECALCLCELQPDHIQLLCGHRCCTECLSGAFNAEAGAPPALPLTCASCRARVSADELRMFAPARGLKRLGEVVRSRLLAEARAEHGEMKECPNRSCRGIPAVVTDAHRRCSGCNLAYCAVCWRNGKLFPWHDGEHYTPTEVLAESLVEELPLLSRCPQCQLPFYDFDGCFALRCRHGHSFCGFCMEKCLHDAHEHVRHCPRNPKQNELYAGSNVFYRCRSEDLAQRMKDVVLQHPAGSSRLAEAVCSKVKVLMSDDWPQDPIIAAELDLKKHQWQTNVVTSSQTSRSTNLVVSQSKDWRNTSSQKSAAMNEAWRLALELAVVSVPAIPLTCVIPQSGNDFFAVVAALQGVGLGDLTALAEKAMAVGESVESAALLLYAVYDVDGSVEALLSSLDREWPPCLSLVSFFHLLLRGMQVHKSSAFAEVTRSACLTADQLALYRTGKLIVWDTPRRCVEASAEEGRAAEANGSDAVEFRIKCFDYARVFSPSSTPATRYVLPAGARLRVTKTKHSVIHMIQESDLVLKL